VTARPPDPFTLGTTDPHSMSPHERLSELAAILAEGLGRPIDAADSAPSPLEQPHMPDVDGLPRG
jgi:hypothetical protein